MASPQFTANDLFREVHKKEWEEVIKILEAQPQIVNEKCVNITLLQRIVESQAPEEVMLKTLTCPTEENLNHIIIGDNRALGEDDNTQHVLHCLADYGYPKALKRTLEISKKGVNDTSDSGNTPLHELLRGNHSYEVHQDGALLLLKAGADTNVRNMFNRTPVEEYRNNPCTKYSDTNSQKKKILIHLTKIIPSEILARGVTAVEAFTEDLLDGKTEIKHGKAVFIGTDGVGKTSTIGSFLSSNSYQDVSRAEEEINDVIEFRRESTSEWQEPGNKFIINVWEFGSQPIYHVIQQIIFASLAFVCVVFNLKDDLNAPAKVKDLTTGKMYQHRMTNLEFIIYWIRLVYTFSRGFSNGKLTPLVLLIGTHLDSLGEKKVKAIFEQIRQAIKGKPYERIVFPTYFHIDNGGQNSMSDVSRIKTSILDIAKTKIRSLPLKWLVVQQKIQKLKKKHIYVPTKEVIDLVTKCGVRNGAQNVLLEYLHDVGEILYFPDEEDLKSIIVLDLLEIFDMSKEIIVDSRLMVPDLKEAYRKLNSLTELGKNKVSENYFDFFVSLMKKFGLVCESKIIKDDQRTFYVLSDLKSERVYTMPVEAYRKQAVVFFLDFVYFLPGHLFERVVIKLIERFQVNDEPKLVYEHAEMDIDERHSVVCNVATIKHRRMFQITIIRKGPDNSEPTPDVCKKVLNFFKEELAGCFPSSVRGVKLRMYIPCVCSPNIRKTHMHIVCNLDNNKLPCGCNGMEVMRYRRLLGDIVPQAHSETQPDVIKANGFVDDAIIATVSEEMDLSWRRFGVRLGLKWSKVKSFHYKESQIHEAVENMMKHWRRKIDSKQHQLNMLCTALRQHGRIDLADMFFNGDNGEETQVIPKQADYFDDQNLLFICENYRYEWNKLGKQLGLSSTIINETDKKYVLEKDSLMEVLVTWRDKTTTNQSLTMTKALRQLGDDQLANRVRERHVSLKDKCTLWRNFVWYVIVIILNVVFCALTYFTDEKWGIWIPVITTLSTYFPLIYNHWKKKYNTRYKRYESANTPQTRSFKGNEYHRLKEEEEI